MSALEALVAELWRHKIARPEPSSTTWCVCLGWSVNRGDYYADENAHNQHVAEALLASPPIAQALAAVEAVGRVEALADNLRDEIQDLRADVPPVGPSRVAHVYRTAGLGDAHDRLRAALRPEGGTQ